MKSNSQYTSQGQSGFSRREVLISTGGVGVLPLISTETEGNSSFQATSNWPTRYYTSGNNAYLPDRTGPRSELRKKWEFDGGGNINHLPVVWDGTAYFGDGTANIYAVDIGSGDTKWRTNNLDIGLANSPVVYNGSLYVITSDARIYQLDLETGDESYITRLETTEYEPDPVETSPIISEDILVVSWESKIRGIDINTGKKIWSFDNATSGHRPFAVGNGVVVYIGDNLMHGIGLDDGSQLWTQRPVYEGMNFLKTPTISDQMVYCGTTRFNREEYDKLTAFYAFDLNTGEQEWHHTYEGISSTGMYPIVSSEYVYFDNAKFRRDGTEIIPMSRLNSLERFYAPFDGDYFYKIASSQGKLHLVQPADNEFSVDTFIELNNVRLRGQTKIILLERALLFWTADGKLVLFEEGTNPVGGSPEFEVSADASSGTVDPTEDTTLEFTITNTGQSTGDPSTYFQPATDSTSHNADYYGDDFNVVAHDDNGGDWQYEGWTWDEVEPGETREPSIELNIVETVEPGEYTFLIQVRNNGSIDDTATVTVTIERGDGITVTDINDNPVADAKYRIIAQGDYDSFGQSNARMVEKGRSNEIGNITPDPNRLRPEDEAVLIMVKKGDWFGVRSNHNPEDIGHPSDYPSPTLINQLLVEPTVARVNEFGDPYGVVSVWRSLSVPSSEEETFQIEITDTNVWSDHDIYDIDYTSVLNGPSTGSFFFTAPEEATIRRQETQTLATHPPGASTLSIGEINPPFEFFHPENDTTDTLQLPIYESTFLLRFMQLTEADLPTQQMGWHELNFDRTEDAREIEDRITTFTDPMLLDGPITGRLCDAVGACFSPLTIADRLDAVLQLLDGDRTIAPAGRGLNNAYHESEFPSPRGNEYTEWKEDLPKTYAESWEGSVVAKFHVEDVPNVRRGTDNELVRYSVEAEWLRQNNNRGVFSQTFTTGPIDVTTHGAAELQADGTAIIESKIHNRTLEPITVDSIEITGDVVASHSVLSEPIEIEPGQPLSIGESVDITEDIRENSQVLITVADNNGNKTSTSVTIVIDNATTTQLVEQGAVPAEETDYAQSIKQPTIRTDEGVVRSRIGPNQSETYETGGEISVAIDVEGSVNDVRVLYQGETYVPSDGEMLVPLKEPGEHDLTIESDSEAETVTIHVESSDISSNDNRSSNETDTTDIENTDNTDTNNTDNGSGSGFGLVGAATSLGGVAYLLKQRLQNDDTSE